MTLIPNPVRTMAYLLCLSDQCPQSWTRKWDARSARVHRTLRQRPHCTQNTQHMALARRYTAAQQHRPPQEDVSCLWLRAVGLPWGWKSCQHKTQTNTSPEMDWRDPPRLSWCGLVSQSTTGRISADTFHAALGVSTSHTGRVHHHCQRRGGEKRVRRQSSTENNIQRKPQKTQDYKEEALWSLSSGATGSPRHNTAGLYSIQIWLHSPGRSCEFMLNRTIWTEPRLCWNSNIGSVLNTTWRDDVTQGSKRSLMEWGEGLWR